MICAGSGANAAHVQKIELKSAKSLLKPQRAPSL